MSQGIVVYYEELQADVTRAMERVAHFLGLSVSLPELQRTYSTDMGLFKKSKEGKWLLCYSMSGG